MKEKKIYDAITDIPDSLIDEAEKTKLKRMHTLRAGFPFNIAASIAACLVLAAGLIFVIPRFVNNNSNTANAALYEVVFPKAYAYADYDYGSVVYDNYPVDDAFLSALDDFSSKTSSQILADSSGNVNYSPLSMYFALAMATSGARGETAGELLDLLGVSEQATLSEQCGNLYRRLYLDNEIGKLSINNSLWMDKSINWKDDFVKNAAENFFTHSFSVDFADGKTGQSMAKWIAEYTNGAQTPLISIDPEQILTVLNTVSFYDEWYDRFDKEKTAEDKFHLADSSAVNCDFMNRTYDIYSFYRGEGFTRSNLAMKNARDMIFILPDENISPRELISTPDKARDVFSDEFNYAGEVVWQIPKFEFNSSLDFADELKSFGVNLAFERDADFSGITDGMAFLRNIRQNTRIGIDENGVEASAFTQIDTMGAPLRTGRADMILNRPFLFGIFARNNTLLFAGICENPTMG